MRPSAKQKGMCRTLPPADSDFIASLLHAESYSVIPTGQPAGKPGTASSKSSKTDARRDGAEAKPAAGKSIKNPVKSSPSVKKAVHASQATNKMKKGTIVSCMSLHNCRQRRASRCSWRQVLVEGQCKHQTKSNIWQDPDITRTRVKSHPQLTANCKVSQTEHVCMHVAFALSCCFKTALVVMPTIFDVTVELDASSAVLLAVQEPSRVEKCNRERARVIIYTSIPVLWVRSCIGCDLCCC